MNKKKHNFDSDDFDSDDDEGYWGMANLSQKHTGLPFVVWISMKMNSPRDVDVKISEGLTVNVKPSELISVAIRPVRIVNGTISKDDLEVLKQWIKLNYDVLIGYWDGEIDTSDALAAIRPIHKIE